MPTTTNKGYEVQTTGSNVGTWGQVLNDNMISYVDQNMGGLTTLSLSSTNVTLSASQSRDAVLRLTGVLLANIQITTACVGFFFVENVTTGSFTVTVTNGVAGVTVPQGQRVILIADGTNGVRTVAQSLGFVNGTTKQVFVNTSVPTGWTADTSVTNGTLRIVGSSGGGSGGTADFTTVFAARTIAANQLPDMTLSITDPGHRHGYVQRGGFTSGDAPGGIGNLWQNTDGTQTDFNTTGITVAINNASRGGVAQQTMDFAVKYRDAIIGTLNG